MSFGRLEAMDLDIVRDNFQERVGDLYLDGLGIDFQSLFLVYKKFLHSIALIALKLNHVASLLIVDDGAIASELLLDDLENLFEIKF